METPYDEDDDLDYDEIFEDEQEWEYDHWILDLDEDYARAQADMYDDQMRNDW